MGRDDLTRTDLGLIAACLADLDTMSMYAAARKYHVDRTTILRWKNRRAERGGQWPTPEEVTAQRLYLAATAERRRRTQRRNALGQYRLVSAVGASRRIQALRAMGYRCSDLATALGVSKGRIHQLSHFHSPTIQITTHEQIRVFYRRMVARPAPVRSPAMMARHFRVAVRNNWAPPLAWESDEDLDNSRAFPNPDWMLQEQDQVA